jgi:predicted CoA-binding protein
LIPVPLPRTLQAMSESADDRATAARILRTCRRVAVVGISPDSSRPSFRVARYLRDAGYEVIPVNPTLTDWQGLPAYPNLRAVAAAIDVVDIFRRSELVGPIVDEAIAVGAHAVWMQDGVVDAVAAARARAAGLMVVMDRCMLRDHAALA